MSNTKAAPANEQALVAEARAKATVFDIFLQFLIIGATSFGGVVPYLRNGLVGKLHWVDDREFVELLSISQSLPGLNATNMAILLGDRLKGWMGAVAGILGVCLPGGLIMLAVGIFYRLHGDHAFVTYMLKGVAAAAAGLLLATVIQLGKKSLSHQFDLVFVLVTVLAVNRLHLGVPKTLVIVGLLAIFFHYPRKNEKESVKQ
ncbi:MAG TPA: chromate transporter [Candidatus Eisenbacteria bacterium]|nr:chromate transporter [Candidatus Eisenbacteria bacterium]